MIELIENTINTIESLIKEQLPESKYQFELFDLITNTKHFRGYNEHFHWGSVYKLFLVAEIVKMVDEGSLNFSDKIILDKKYKKGTGILKYLNSINEISIEDACSLIFFTSDNICSDMFFETTKSKVNDMFEKSGCNNLKISTNLDTIISLIEPKINFDNVNYIYSQDFYNHYDKVLDLLITTDYCHVTDINNCFNFILNGYYSDENKKRLMEILQIPNIVSKFSYDIAFNRRIVMKGKTGTLGFGIVSNECVAIFESKTLNVLGYFSLLTKNNKNRFYEIYNTLGIVAQEVICLYEQLEKQN